MAKIKKWQINMMSNWNSTGYKTHSHNKDKTNLDSEKVTIQNSSKCQNQNFVAVSISLKDLLNLIF